MRRNITLALDERILREARFLPRTEAFRFPLSYARKSSTWSRTNAATQGARIGGTSSRPRPGARGRTLPRGRISRPCRPSLTPIGSERGRVRIAPRVNPFGPARAMTRPWMRAPASRPSTAGVIPGLAKANSRDATSAFPLGTGPWWTIGLVHTVPGERLLDEMEVCVGPNRLAHGWCRMFRRKGAGVTM